MKTGKITDLYEAAKNLMDTTTGQRWSRMERALSALKVDEQPWPVSRARFEACDVIADLPADVVQLAADLLRGLRDPRIVRLTRENLAELGKHACDERLCPDCDGKGSVRMSTDPGMEQPCDCAVRGGK